MITTLAWWQIVGLTLLTLIVVGILKRLVILIVMGLTPNSLELIRNPMSVDEQNPHRGNLSVSRSDTYVSDPTPESWVGQDPHELMANMSTGATPSGVSYSPKDVESLVRNRKSRFPRLFKGRHPHV